MEVNNEKVSDKIKLAFTSNVRTVVCPFIVYIFPPSFLVFY